VKIIGSCDCCGYREIPVEAMGDIDPNLRRQPNYCRICSETFASAAIKRIDILQNPANYYRTLCYMGNLILSELRREIQKLKGAS
jgi:hypothetical protein